MGIEQSAISNSTLLCDSVKVYSRPLISYGNVIYQTFQSLFTTLENIVVFVLTEGVRPLFKGTVFSGIAPARFASHIADPFGGLRVGRFCGSGAGPLV